MEDGWLVLASPRPPVSKRHNLTVAQDVVIAFTLVVVRFVSGGEVVCFAAIGEAKISKCLKPDRLRRRFLREIQELDRPALPDRFLSLHPTIPHTVSPEGLPPTLEKYIESAET